MAKGTPPQNPLVISFFGTGLYTYRNQLFSPFRGVGINVVSFHDAALDGHNMELTDLLEWQQRPGYTQYCSVALNQGELINQFYSERALLNSALMTFADTNQRLITFTPTAITTIFTKTTAAQGFLTQVGDTTYYFDGADAVRYDQLYNVAGGGYASEYGNQASPVGIAAPGTDLSVSATGVWLPNTGYSITTYPGTPINGGNGYDVSLVYGTQVVFWPHNHAYSGQFEYTFPGDGFSVPLGTNGASLYTANIGVNQSINFNTYPNNYLPDFPVTNQNIFYPQTAPGITNVGTWDGTNVPVWSTNQPPNNYCMVITGLILITTPGQYTFQVSHDDGILIGIGGGAVFISASDNNNPDPTQTKTAAKGYPLMYAFNNSQFHQGSTFVVNFPTAGAYPIECDYCQWESEQNFSLDWLNPASANALTPLVPTSYTGGTGAGSVGAVILDYNGNIEYSGSSSGISGSTEPVWAPLPGAFTNDGAGIKWENLGPIGTWIANTPYTSPSVIQDSNGNLQMLYTLNAPGVWNSQITYEVGQTVQFGTLYYINVLAGANNPPGSNVNNPGWVIAGNPAISGATEPQWALNIGGFTNDGFNPQGSDYWMVWQNLGPATTTIQSGYSWGLCYRTLDGHLSTMSAPSITVGPQLQGSQITPSQVISYSIANDVVTIICNNTFAPGELVYVQGMQTGTELNNLTLTVTSSIPSLSYTITATTVTSNVVTITTNNSLTAGETVTLTGLTTSTFLNNQVLTVLSSGLNNTQFKANFTHANYSTAADTGLASLTSQFTGVTGGIALPNTSSTPDVGTVTPVIAQITGVNSTDPRCGAFAYGITNVSLIGNIVTLTTSTNYLFPGTTVLITGLTGADWLNDFTLLVLTATPTQVTAYFKHNDYASTADTGTATFCGIEIYRTADGGGIWYLVGAVVNTPGQYSAGQFTFVDIYTDQELENEIIAPIAHLNDPPPGQTGSFATPFAAGSICTYWQGRLWLAQGQYLYFDAGGDCQNGDPHQSWPPGNRFEFAGKITGLAPLEKGLLVWIGDRMGVVLGGPQTLTFYPITIMKNFGVSSPNCLWVDGQTCYILTTQGQCYAVSLGNRSHVGEKVADLIQKTFNPSSSYITFHRNGLDVGLFLADGVDNILRYGANVGAWSSLAEVVGGVGAIASVETSPGTYSLLAAPTTTGGSIQTTTTVFSDNATDLSTPTAWTNGWSGGGGCTVVTAPAGLPSGFGFGPNAIQTTPFAGARVNTSVTNFANTTISFWFYFSTDEDPLFDFYFGCNSTGSGVGLRIDARNEFNGGSGFFTQSTWFGGGTGPIDVGVPICSVGAWHNITIAFNAAGTQASWSLDGTLEQNYTALTLNGGYLGICGDFPENGTNVAYAGINMTQTTITPVPAGNIMVRNLKEWQDANGAYETIDVTIGNIILSQPGSPLVPVQHIIGYFDSVDSNYPSISILPNEIAATNGANFINIPEDQIVSEPPIGAAPSVSLQQLRYPVNMINSLNSQYMHHLQVRISFGNNNAQHTLKALAIKSDQD